MALISVLILNCFSVIFCATFENVSVILKWRSGIQDNTTVAVLSDNYLRKYVGEFGEVIISNQNIPRLTQDSVSNLAKVTHLHLTDCKIKKIENGALKNLPSLTDLNLSGNLLEAIENGIFDYLDFKTLYLENNLISRIHDRAFNNLKMEYLFIDDNRIHEWNSEWFNGTPLRWISMRNNKLENLDRLAFEYLWHFPDDVVLENFILSGNKINNIHRGAFDGVKTIHSLSLDKNSLKKLQPGLFDYVQLIGYLDLSNNLISEIYYQTFKKTKLIELNVYNNFITCIPTDIFNATELEKLNAGENPISCDCYKTWKKWKEDFVVEITNLVQLEEECKSSGSWSVKQKLILLWFLYLFSDGLFSIKF